MGIFSWPFSMISSVKLARYPRTSRGRFPKGRVAFLIVLRGLLAAKEMPRYSPVAFTLLGFHVKALLGVSWVAWRAKVSRWPTKLLRSS